MQQAPDRLSRQVFDRPGQTSSENSWRVGVEELLEYLKSKFPECPTFLEGEEPKAFQSKIDAFERIYRKMAWQALESDARRMPTVAWYSSLTANTGFKMQPQHQFPYSKQGRYTFLVRIRGLMTLRDAKNWGFLGKKAYGRVWPRSSVCWNRNSGDSTPPPDGVGEDRLYLPDREAEVQRIYCTVEEDMEHVLYHCVAYDGVRDTFVTETRARLAEAGIRSNLMDTQSLVQFAISGGDLPTGGQATAGLGQLQRRNAKKANALRCNLRTLGSKLCYEIVKYRADQLWPLHSAGVNGPSVYDNEATGHEA